MRRLAILTSQAFSLPNFRGPLIKALTARGVEVLALAPDYDAGTRDAVAALGAQPIDYSLERAGLSATRDALHLVSLARLLIEHLAGGGHLEALFGAGLGLDLGHLALLDGTQANGSAFQPHRAWGMSA